MAEEASAIELSQDDEQARRLCALAIMFQNAGVPLSSPEIYASIYPGGDNYDSCYKQFKRDLEKLAECGLLIRQVGQDNQYALWQADPSSFAGSSLSPESAHTLSILCTPLVKDPSFSRRDDLRLALAKIDHTYGKLTAAQLPPTEQAGNVQKTMLACVAQGKLAKISYVDASGKPSERIVAPYGHFGLRGKIYFVCAQTKDGQADLGDVRTFRCDRISKARQLSTSFELPGDFSMEDYIKLPFQIGPTTCNIQLAVPDDADKDLLVELDRRASKLDGGVRQVDASDVTAAARWAIAAGLRPLAPQELHDAWQGILTEATQSTAQPQLPQGKLEHPRLAKGRRGRPGGGYKVREIMALVGSLQEESATLEPATVAARLGVSEEHAELLINLILTSCTDTGYMLPLGETGDGGVVLSRSKGVTGKPLRLTPTEAQALIDAFDKLSYPADDQLRLDVISAFAPVGTAKEDASAGMELPPEETEILEACSNAISSGKGLSFSYQKTGQNSYANHSVIPQGLRYESDHRYLDAYYSPDNPKLYAFRIDRMQNVHVTAGAGTRPVASTARQSKRMVSVTFVDKSPLDLFEWPGLELLGTSEGLTVTQLPYYGGSWLPRHLAACGKLAYTSDEELAAQTRALAAKLLA